MYIRECILKRVYWREYIGECILKRVYWRGYTGEGYAGEWVLGLVLYLLSESVSSGTKETSTRVPEVVLYSRPETCGSDTKVQTTRVKGIGTIVQTNRDRGFWNYSAVN